MSDLFAAPGPAAPPHRQAERRPATMPARFLWPDDVLIWKGAHRVLERVEVNGLTIQVYAGGGPLVLDPNQVVDVMTLVPADPRTRQ